MSLILFALPFFLSSCTTSPRLMGPNQKQDHQLEEQSASSNNCELYEKHIIALDTRGGFIPVTFKPAPDGKKCKFEIGELQLENRRNSASEQIDKVFEGIRASTKDPFIFIHGGLNNYKDSLNRVLEDAQKITKHGQYYPIFIIWPSGIETYWDSLAGYFQGEWDRSLDSSMSPFKLITDAVTIPVRLMTNYATSFRLTTDSACLNGDTGDPRLRIPWCRNLEKNNDSYLINDPCKKNIQKIPGFHCIEVKEEDLYSFFDFHDLITLPAKLVTIPLVDPFTKRGWNSMNARIRFAFRTPCPIDRFTPGNCEPGFVYEFFKTYRDQFANSDKKITLFGHSMGAILSGEIIREFSDLQYKAVIFGGAAINIREFKNTIETALKEKEKKYKEYSDLIKQLRSLKSDISVSERMDETIARFEYLQKNYEPFKFYNLSLHPFAESTEDNFYGLAPNGSLLEWIDLHIENPADTLDRTLGKWVNITSILATQAHPSDNYFDSNLLTKGYMHFSRFGLNKNQPLRHAHFGDSFYLEYWKPENWIQDTEIRQAGPSLSNMY
ncbi:MAG: hypothetical protein Q7T35_09070 [Nitrosomonas sp.]|nr:hypothetical protein [Nitrosomonas sp.]